MCLNFSVLPVNCGQNTANTVWLKVGATRCNHSSSHPRRVIRNRRARGRADSAINLLSRMSSRDRLFINRILNTPHSSCFTKSMVPGGSPSLIDGGTRPGCSSGRQGGVTCMVYKGVPLYCPIQCPSLQYVTLKQVPDDVCGSHSEPKPSVQVL